MSPAQKKDSVGDCIFCKIVAGQIKAKVVYEAPNVVAFRDINPQAPVHILIIPKRHVTRVSELRPGDYSLLVDIHQAAIEIAKQENVVESGFRLVTNNGENAGQMVDHLHYHVLGGREFSWPPG